MTLGETSIIVYDEITPRVLIIIGNLETGASDKKLRSINMVLCNHYNYMV